MSLVSAGYCENQTAGRVLLLRTLCCETRDDQQFQPERGSMLATSSRGRQSGFSVVELIVAVAIVLIVAAFATPTILSMIHTAKLQGTATDFTNLVQQARIRSVQDDRSYSLLVSPAAGATPSTAFVDLKQNGAIAAGDPEMLLPTEVALVAAAK